MRYTSFLNKSLCLAEKPAKTLHIDQKPQCGTINWEGSSPRQEIKQPHIQVRATPAVSGEAESN